MSKFSRTKEESADFGLRAADFEKINAHNIFGLSNLASRTALRRGEIREYCAHLFTETFLHHNVLDQAAALNVHSCSNDIFSIIPSHMYIHRSATTLKPLTSDDNNIDHLIAMQCSAGETLGTGIHVNAT